MEEIKSPLKAIREFCIDCNGGSQRAVKECPSKDCPLKPFRMGKNPFRIKREMTEEQRRIASERLAKFRKEKA